MRKCVRGKRRVRWSLGVWLVISLGTPRMWAWGREGHKLTALVAENYLAPETRVEVEELLGKQTLADVASWADDYRSDHPETASWHYVDIPGSAETFDRLRDCPVSALEPRSPWRDCVTDRILYFEGRLGDTSLPPKERAMALKFLVHLIGDVHQPFHALGDARGGNAITVRVMGGVPCSVAHCNLHSVWDDGLIEDKGLSDKKYLSLLLEEINENHWDRMAGGSPSTWADVSHRCAVNAELADGALVSPEYVKEESRIVDFQLATGGLRLARVLNRILGAQPESQPQRTPLSSAGSPVAVLHP
jgi:hypothetical protein